MQKRRVTTVYMQRRESADVHLRAAGPSLTSLQHFDRSTISHDMPYPSPSKSHRPTALASIASHDRSSTRQKASPGSCLLSKALCRHSPFSMGTCGAAGQPVIDPRISIPRRIHSSGRRWCGRRYGVGVELLHPGLRTYECDNPHSDEKPRLNIRELPISANSVVTPFAVMFYLHHVATPS